MANDIQDLLQRRKRLADGRRPWETHWQELGETLLPRRADFSTAASPGAKRTEKQFDGTPMQAARGLAASLDGLLKGKSGRWFGLRVSDSRLMALAPVRLWLEAAEQRIYDALYDPRARFLQRSNEVDLDLVVFGTGILFIGEKIGGGHLQFRSHHLRDTYLAESADGDIDTVFRNFRLTARQAAQRFGRDALGAKTKEALKDGKPDTEFAFLHAVTPRADRNPDKRTNRNMAFASLFIDIESEHLVSESGYSEFPYVVPRWDTATDEVYGRSPGMLALPDAHTLNQMGKTLLRAGHKAVDPPLLMPDDGVKAGPRTWPGGITYYDADVLGRTGGRPPITPLVTGANLPLGREMQNDVRQQVWGAFFRNVLQLPVEGPQMTATEILQRKEEFMRVIGPTFGRLEADYTGPLIERVFAVMQRAGMLPQVPPELVGAKLSFRYASPITRAARQIEAASLRKTLDDLAVIAATEPSVMDNFDADRIARDVAEANGLPQRWLKPAASVGAARAKRDREAASATAVAELERAAKGFAAVGKVPGAVDALAELS